MKEDIRSRPWDPLYWRGAPAVPQAARPPAFEKHVFHTGGDEELMAQGRAYTDGACRGFLRRTRRAGWGACVTDEEGHLILGIYGTCPDSYAS